MPPSCSGASSGARTAHRTSRNSATIGIFNKTINQMKVQVVTAADRIPGALRAQPPARDIRRNPGFQSRSSTEEPLNWVIARSSSTRVEISAAVRRSTRSVPNSSTLKDASAVA